METSEKRLLFLYEHKLGHNAAEATRNINTAFGEATVSERTAQRWFEKFRSGDMSLESEPSGRPVPAIDNDELRTLVESNPRQSVRDIAQNLGVHYSTVSRHLQAIGKVKKLDKWVPHDLTEQNMATRLEVCSSLLIRNKTVPFLSRIVTCDEKWILYDNRRRSAQWLDADEAPKHMPKPGLHPRKIMVSVWWSAAGIIHYSFLNPGETINSEKYCSQLEEMHQQLLIKQPALVNRHGVILLHDNARPHVSRTTVQKLQELQYETLPHPPYSPDLSPTDYHFFKHLDHFLVGKKFNNEAAVKSAFEEFINCKNSDFYKSGVNALVSRWEKCIASAGAYFD